MCVRQNLKRFEYKRDTHNIRWVTDAGQALALFWYTLYQLWHSNPRSGRCCAERNWWAMETSRLQGADYPRDDHPTAWPEKHYRTLFAQLKYWWGITESPAILSNSFSSMTAFSVKKLTHSEFWIWTVQVPNQLPSLHLFSDWCGKLSVSNKNCR